MTKQHIYLLIFIIILLAGVFIFWKSPKQADVIENPNTTQNENPTSYECNADGKICPDGSVVGRTGPMCQFEACPNPERTEATVVTSMGQVSTAMNVSITPKKLISDSRCQKGVRCIWAGTVEVQAVTTTQVSHGEQVFNLGEEKAFGDYTITLTEVTPAKEAEVTIPESAYRFTFLVKKK